MAKSHLLYIVLLLISLCAGYYIGIPFRKTTHQYLNIPATTTINGNSSETTPLTPDMVPIPEVASPYDGCDTCAMPARQIAWSLDNQPDEWVGDDITVHRGYIWIWIADGAQGVTVGKYRYVGPHGFGWKPTQAEKYLINRAYERWNDRYSLHAGDIHP